MRRGFYLLMTNAAIMVVVGVILMLFTGAFGGQNSVFLIMTAVFGFGSSIIALFRSKSAAIQGAGVQLISEPRNQTEQWLLQTVKRQAEQAGIGMPDVGVFHAPEMNAFATGAKRDNALVAVSTGLLENMTQDEVEAVLGHEIAHVANGDMITLTLILGMVNVLVLFLARAVASVIGSGRGRIGYMIGFFVGQMFFGFLANLVVAYFSRQREYRADAGGADYASTQKMIAALERLKQGQAGQLPNQLAAFGINNNMKELFSTHPPLQDRINALKNR